MTTAWRVSGAGRSRAPSVRMRVLTLFVLHLGILVVLATRSDRPTAGPLLAAAAFWGLLAAFPHAINRRTLLSPRNYFVFLFFMSMVVGPAVMLSAPLLPRLWILRSATWDTERVWDYMLPGAIVWTVAFAAYLFGARRAPTGPPREPDPTTHRQPPASDWMLVAGLALIGAGVAGLTLALGSLADAATLGGNRARSEAALVSGTYRYTAWMEGVPLGAALVWYYVTRRLHMGRFGAAAWVVILYAPLFPFYLYSSGRGRALVPLLILVALYHRFVHRFHARWLVVGMVVLLPTLAAWSLYRKGVSDITLSQGSVTEVAAADFSRYDVSVVGLAGFHQAELGYLMGSTYAHAALAWVPSSLSSGFIDGTTALARALSGSGSWDTPTSYATSMVIEAYLNFGIVGVAVVSLLFGLVVRRLDALTESPDLLPVLLALSVSLKLPFAIATSVAAGQIVWAVGLPFATAWGARALLGRTPSRATTAISRAAAR